MMASAASPRWTHIFVLGLIFFLVLMLVLNSRSDNPCLTKTTQELVTIYPDLNVLKKKHQLNTDKLLTLHRTQDVLINLKMTSEQIDPELALQISMQQVNELAAMRQAQEKEFNALCHNLEKGENQGG